MASDSQISGEITTLLQRWSGGDAAALDDLVEIAYQELHAIAAGYLRQENRYQTLQATELVSELYMRLARQRTAQFSGGVSRRRTFRRTSPPSAYPSFPPRDLANSSPDER